MSKINMGKVILGGILGGIVLNIIDYLVNGVWLAPQWTAAAAKFNTGVDAMGSSAVASYIVGDFVFAILIVWTYAAIRSRFGPGAGTAAKAAVIIWLVGAIIGAQMVVGGMYPGQLMATSSVCTLIGMIAAGYVGGTVYKE
jgi:hypothetical protein